MRVWCVLAASAAFTAMLSSAEASVNLVTNGSFETGDLTGWSSTYWEVDQSPPISWFTAADGKYLAAGGCTFFCSLSQTLTTTVGQSYDLTFAFNPGETHRTSDVHETRVYWDGKLVTDLNGGSQAWTTYKLTGLTATSSATTLTFSSRQDWAFAGVDAVSVLNETPAAVPEASIWAMFLIGFGMIGTLARMRKTVTADFAA